MTISKLPDDEALLEFSILPIWNVPKPALWCSAGSCLRSEVLPQDDEGAGSRLLVWATLEERGERHDGTYGNEEDADGSRTDDCNKVMDGPQ